MVFSLTYNPAKIIRGIIIIGAIPDATLGSLKILPAIIPIAFPAIETRIRKEAKMKKLPALELFRPIIQYTITENTSGKKIITGISVDYLPKK